MKTQYWLTGMVGRTTLVLALAAVVGVKSAHAEDKIKIKNSNLKKIEFSKNLKIRGFQLSNGVYMGQAKVAGKYGFGVVVDRKSYFWGINNRGISISKRF